MNTLEYTPMPQERSGDMALERSLGTELSELLQSPHLMENSEKMLEKLEALQKRISASGIESDNMRAIKEKLKEKIREYDLISKGLM